MEKRRSVSGWFIHGLTCLSVLLMAPAVALADVAEAPVIYHQMWGASGEDGGWSHSFNTGSYGTVAGAGNFFLYEGSASWAECDITWWHDVEVDPVLGFGFAVTNNLPFTETFVLTTFLQVPGWSNGTLQGASISASLTDTNADGTASLVANSGGLLTTFLDGAEQISVGAGASASVNTIAGSTVFGPFSAGLGPTGPNLVGPQSTDGLLRVDIAFELSAGDTATLNGAYIVEYVPAPGALVVLAAAGLFGSRRRRR